VHRLRESKWSCNRQIRAVRSWFVSGGFAEIRQVFKGERLLLWITIGGLGVVAGCGLVVAKLLDDLLGADGVVALDPSITSWVVEHRTTALTDIAQVATWFGNPWVVLLVVAAAVVFLVALRRARLALFIAASTSGAAIASTFGKSVVDRPRPPSSLWLVSASGAAFPSGHATQSIACYGALAVVGVSVLSSRWTRALVAGAGAALALAIGSSRVYLGVHWSTDVLCGWAIASMWVATLVLLGWARPRVHAGWLAARRGA